MSVILRRYTLCLCFVSGNMNPFTTGCEVLQKLFFAYRLRFSTDEFFQNPTPNVALELVIFRVKPWRCCWQTRSTGWPHDFRMKFGLSQFLFQGLCNYVICKGRIQSVVYLSLFKSSLRLVFLCERLECHCYQQTGISPHDKQHKSIFLSLVSFSYQSVLKILC